MRRGLGAKGAGPGNWRGSREEGAVALLLGPQGGED